MVYNMKHYFIYVVLGITVSVCGAIPCAKRHQHSHQEEPQERIPSCTYNAGLISCYYLGATDMDMLEQALQETANFETSFGIEITYSDGPAIPVDVFAGYGLTTVILGGDNYTTMNDIYGLLSYINSPLIDLTIDNYVFSSLEISTPDMLLPFSDNLLQLDISMTNIQRVDPSTFTQYTNLEELWLENNEINGVGLEFVGLHSLKGLYMSTNNISTIETGAFRDLGNLQYLGLFENNLVTLQEDAFMGLETSPIISVDLGYNPFNCTCALQWLKDWLNERNLTEASEARCAYPQQAYFNDLSFC